MPWNWKADVSLLVGWFVETAGAAAAVLGGIGGVITKKVADVFKYIEDKPIGYLLGSHMDLNATITPELPVPVSPIYLNISKDFSKNGSFIPVPSNTKRDSTLSVIERLTPEIAIPAGIGLRWMGRSLTELSFSYRQAELKEAFDHGRREGLSHKLSCCRVWLCGTLSSVLDAGATTMLFAAFAMLAGEEGLGKLADWLPASLREALPEIFLKKSYDVDFYAGSYKGRAHVNATLEESNNCGMLDLSKIKNGLNEAAHSVADFIPFLLIGGAVATKFFSAKLDQRTRYYRNFNAGIDSRARASLLDDEDLNIDYVEMRAKPN